MDMHMVLFIPTWVLSHLSLLAQGFSYGFPRCTEYDFENLGYTYTIDRRTGDFIWTLCEFPNPKFDKELCGLPKIRSPRYLCDPGNILTQQEGILLDGSLRQVVTDKKSPAVCVNNNGEEERITLVMILLDQIRLPDLSTNNTCINQCGEIRPSLDTSERSPNSEEINVAMETFASGVRRHIRVGYCDNDVVILYSKNLHEIYTSLGDRAKANLNVEKLTDLNADFLTDTREGKLTLAEALRRLAEGYRTELHSALNPAQVLLLLTTTALIVLSMFLYFYSHLEPVAIESYEKPKLQKTVGCVMYILCGLWLFDLILYSVFYIEQKAEVWHILALLTVVISCLVVSAIFM